MKLRFATFICWFIALSAISNDKVELSLGFLILATYFLIKAERAESTNNNKIIE